MKEAYQKLQEQFSELGRALESAEVLSSPEKIKKVSKEYNELAPLAEKIQALKRMEREIAKAEQVESDTTNAELALMAKEEIRELTEQQTALEAALAALTTPQDPLDKKDVIVEIRAGAGGEEAALFAAELFRMYARFAEERQWKTLIASQNRTEIGGFKEIIFTIAGREVYAHLKYESGVHRVQRVPETEKSGRVHTSTATVAVLPEIEEVEFHLDPKDLKIETSTARGHGGQSVNTTYSAIRVTHLPTGIMVSCQDERSQQQNRERAMQILRSRLFELEEEKRRRKRAQERKSQIGTGDRSEKIRTYNFPQDRVTDHRINQNFHSLDRIMDGGIAPIIEALDTADKIG